MSATHPSHLFVDTLQHLGLHNAIRNVQTELDTLMIDGQPVPVTLNEEEYNNSYVCSPYTAYISYAEDELNLIHSPRQRRALKLLIRIADRLLKLAKINQTLSINNWLVSTNLPPQWDPDSIPDLTRRLIQRYPNHSFSIRSLNRQHNLELMNALQKNGWLLIPARQVYLFDNQSRDWWKKSHTKRDQKLLEKTDLLLVEPEAHKETDFDHIYRCFHQLFIEKHSHFNPQFTAPFLYEMHLNGLMKFYSLRQPQDGRIVGSIALFTQQEIITTPMVGYDTSLPQSLGLYRLLMAVLLRETYQSGQRMNLSSGAGHFKRARGGVATIEYTAFYTQHLSCRKKWIMTLFAKLLNRYGPKVFEENGL